MEKLIELIKHNAIEIHDFAKSAEKSDNKQAEKLLTAIKIETKEILARIEKYKEEKDV